MIQPRTIFGKEGFIRLAGIATILAALSILSARFIQDTPVVIYGVTLIGSLVGFIGIFLYQKDRAGVLSILSLAFLLLTFFFYGSGRDQLGDISFPIAFLVLGLATFQSGKYPRWATLAILLGVVINMIGSFLAFVPRVVDLVNAFIFAAGYIMVGFTLWDRPAKSSL